MTFWYVSNKLVGEGRVIVWSNLLTNQRYGIVNGLHIVVHCCIFFHSIQILRDIDKFFFFNRPNWNTANYSSHKKTRKEKLIKKTSIIKKIYRFIEKPNHHQQQLLLCNYNILFSLIP